MATPLDIGSRPEPNKVATAGNDLSECIFSREAALAALLPCSVIPGEISLDRSPSGGILLTWGSSRAARPDPSMPSILVLKVPDSQLSPWELKADVLANSLSGVNEEERQPLRTSFFKALMEQGYEVVSISNASLENADVRFKFARQGELSNVTLSVQATIECAQLSLNDVRINESKIEFRVDGGSWTKVLVSKGHISGCLGATVMDESCVFNDPRVSADCRQTDFGSNLRARLIGGLYDGSVMPQAVRDILSPADPEDIRKRQAAIDALRFSSVPDKGWVARTDRSA